MPETNRPPRALHENLDTAYVNLGALLRYLQGRDFTGRVRVELDEYEADILLRPGEAPRVRERDFATGREDEGEAALHRLLVRAREPGGLVSVYEEEGEGTEEGAGANLRSKIVAAEAEASAAAQASGVVARASEEEAERREFLQLSGELIAAVERAATVAGGDFASAFHRARIALADDYPFLDPVQRRFVYADGEATLRGAGVSAGLYVSGVCEALRRAVAQMAEEGGRIGVRRDAARELSTLARRRQSALARFKFTPHLERIAGMRLL